MLLSAAIANIGLYYAVIACVYGCIATIIVLAVIYGSRARRNVKNESVTKLPDGFSPLDVKRIFIGKTYPRRLTRALIAHWAQCGYITVKYASRFKVTIRKIKNMPPHFSDDAVFFDRGTYVRERDLFMLMTEKAARGESINLLKPLFTKAEVNTVNNSYAVREDEGVYTAKHYRLKVLTLALSVIPLAIAAVWIGVNSGVFMTFALVGTAIIGMSVLMFVRGMPILFKAVWCGMWLGCSIGGIIAFSHMAYDPYGTVYAAVVIFFVGPLVLRRFADYREKINLAEYSALINYRKYLLRAHDYELCKQDYYAALPFLYAFGIKPFVKRKFGEQPPPKWYKSDGGERSALL